MTTDVISILGDPEQAPFNMMSDSHVGLAEMVQLVNRSTFPLTVWVGDVHENDYGNFRMPGIIGETVYIRKRPTDIIWCEDQPGGDSEALTLYLTKVVYHLGPDPGTYVDTPCQNWSDCDEALRSPGHPDRPSR
jgi:hypothetical protein